MTTDALSCVDDKTIVHGQDFSNYLALLAQQTIHWKPTDHPASRRLTRTQDHRKTVSGRDGQSRSSNYCVTGITGRTKGKPFPAFAGLSTRMMVFNNGKEIGHLKGTLAPSSLWSPYIHITNQ
jgi:hypothetical protein